MEWADCGVRERFGWACNINMIISRYPFYRNSRRSSGRGEKRACSWERPWVAFTGSWLSVTNRPPEPPTVESNAWVLLLSWGWGSSAPPTLASNSSQFQLTTLWNLLWASSSLRPALSSITRKLGLDKDGLLGHTSLAHGFQDLSLLFTLSPHACHTWLVDSSHHYYFNTKRLLWKLGVAHSLTWAVLWTTTTKRHGQINYILSHRLTTSLRETFACWRLRGTVSVSITGGKPANPVLISVPFCLGTSEQPYCSYWLR